MASAGWPERHGLAVDLELAAARTVRPREDVEQLVLALPLERDDAEHLARVELERDVLQLRRRALRPRTTRRGSARPAVRRRSLGDAAAATSLGDRRPSISSTMRSSDPGVTSTTPTVSPSRRTVARSQTAAISIMRCEMKIDGPIAAALAADRPRARAR